MKRFTRSWLLALFCLVLTGVLAACGDPTATPAPAMTTSAAMTTGAAMASKTTEGAMMASGTPGAAMTTGAAMMGKETPGAAMTTGAAMAQSTSGAAMTTGGAMMAQGTPGAAMTTGAAMAGGAMMAKLDTLFMGDFNNQGAEPVAGKAILGKTADNKIILRFENLKSASAPDLYVYLTKDGSPANSTQIMAGLEVGKLTATEGSLDYTLDSKLDVSQYKSVAIFCKSSSTVYGYANITMQPA